MKLPFVPLAEELQRWGDAGLTLPVWWRDDDAVQPTAALDRLVALSARFEAPLHLAVIPHFATGELAALAGEATAIFALPHGWRHVNHASNGAKKAEFGPQRSLDVMTREAGEGWRRILALFGTRAKPILVPPWNRVAPALLPELVSCGLAAVSTFSRRRARFAAPSLLAVNTHLDPIDWHGSRSLVDAGVLAHRAAEELRARRLGDADASEPWGLLTHHLIHDEAIWAFTEDLLDLLARSGVARWVDPLREAEEADASAHPSP